jgi:ABC-type transport system involved in multi-copper enzyme maturation permease subunit
LFEGLRLFVGGELTEMARGRVFALLPLAALILLIAASSSGDSEPSSLLKDSVLPILTFGYFLVGLFWGARGISGERERKTYATYALAPYPASLIVTGRARRRTGTMSATGARSTQPI